MNTISKLSLVACIVCMLSSASLSEPIHGWYTKQGIALIIGNDEYDYGSNLELAITDAKSLEEALAKVDFMTIITAYNLDKKDLKVVMDSFALNAKHYGKALVYFSGQGLELDGEFRMLPKDAKGASAEELLEHSIGLHSFSEQMQGNRPTLFLIDACRNTPFGSKPKQEGKGLSNMYKNKLYAYAATPGQLVSDTNLFTEHFVNNLKPKKSVIEILKQLNKDSRASESYNLWIEGDIGVDFYFNKKTKSSK